MAIGNHLNTVALNALACPHCRADLHSEEGMLRCASGHSFDVARQGYVSLLAGGGRADTADSVDMVSARERFLASGAYDGIAEAAAAAVASHLTADTRGVFVDIGAGTGWLLGRLLETEQGRSGIALDVSKFAARRSAHASSRAISVVANAWETLPLKSESAALVVSFFAPRNPAEFHRLLAPGGVALVISPQPDHLAQLVGPLSLVSVDERKAERLDRSFGESFEEASLIPFRTEVTLTQDRCRDLALMGPSAHHANRDGLDKALRDLPNPIVATIAVDLRVFVPRP